MVLLRSSLSWSNTCLHVCIIRSVSGNQPHILKCRSSHKKFLGAVLSSSLTRHHRANQASSLKTEKLFGLPVLMSGTAALTLLKTEIDTLALHYKSTLEGPLKIHKNTPEPFVFLMSGSLPFPAILYLKQLRPFGMVCWLEDSILHRIGKYLLTISPDSSHSWFIQTKKICQQYKLPQPLALLENPPSLKKWQNSMPWSGFVWWVLCMIIITFH